MKKDIYEINELIKQETDEAWKNASSEASDATDEAFNEDEKKHKNNSDELSEFLSDLYSCRDNYSRGKIIEDIRAKLKDVGVITSN